MELHRSINTAAGAPRPSRAQLLTISPCSAAQPKPICLQKEWQRDQIVGQHHTSTADGCKESPRLDFSTTIHRSSACGKPRSTLHAEYSLRLSVFTKNFVLCQVKVSLIWLNLYKILSTFTISNQYYGMFIYVWNCKCWYFLLQTRKVARSMRRLEVYKV